MHFGPEDDAGVSSQNTTTQVPDGLLVAAKIALDHMCKVGCPGTDELDDGEDLMGDPDEYDEPWCNCSAGHSIEEMDWNRCDCCGKDIK